MGDCDAIYLLKDLDCAGPVTACEPKHCRRIDDDGQPENRAVRLLRCLVPEFLLCERGRGPAAREREEVQLCLGRSPTPLLSRALVARVNQKCDGIDHQPSRKQLPRVVTEKRHGNYDQRPKRGNPQAQARSSGACLSQLVRCTSLLRRNDGSNLHRTTAPVRVQPHFESDQTTHLRTSPPRKLIQMNKDFPTARIRQHKAKALVVIPFNEFSLIAHGRVLRETTGRGPCATRSRSPRGLLAP